MSGRLVLNKVYSATAASGNPLALNTYTDTTHRIGYALATGMDP